MPWIVFHFYYITVRTRSVSATADQQKEPCRRHGNFLPPPRKTAGRRCAPQAKKPPEWATVSEFVLIWCDFTLKSEPISEKTPKAQPRRLRACNARRPHQKNPLLIFLFPPAEFLFWNWKGCFLVVRLLQAVKASGLRSGGRAAALCAIYPLCIVSKTHTHNRCVCLFFTLPLFI